MGQLSSIEREAVERASGEPMLDQVLAWAAINSGSRNLTGLERMAEMLTDAFAALPGVLRLEHPQTVETVNSAGKTAKLKHGRHLHLTVRPTAPVQLLLTGHMDTVFAADHPFQQTRWLEDGILNGPGVADMKGGLSVMLGALKAVEKSKLADRLGYEVVINSDEEVGSLASAALLKQAAQGKHAALTYEPAALPDGTLAGARPGSGNFSFVIRGRSAHAGRNPEDGRNAVVAASELALRLAMSKTPGLSVNPARIEGGSPSNVVPDLAILRVNMRPRTTDDQEIAGRLIAKAVDETARQHEVYIEVHGGFGRPPKP
ncbi:MAG TPA: hydrolase, partial [Sphingomicrobium sp.]|nr:hydrolase [Sphingomicrobium sp.]